MTKKEYNGWYNYETWLFGLWFSADHFKEDLENIIENHAREIGSFLTDEELQILQFEDCLKSFLDEYQDTIETPVEGFFSNLLNGAISEINFHEIAKTWFHDLVREMETA